MADKTLERVEGATYSQRETELYPEIPGDVFDRQRCVDGWDVKNTKVSGTTAFVVGTGGVGCNVAFSLARLGVGKIILLDYDTVDGTNLNRQILFSKHDVGKRKVDAAAANLDAFHNLGSEIETLDLDAIRNWDTVVATAQASTVIFNCIDYGGVADKALASLAYSLGIPYVTASTYGNIFQNEFYSGAEGALAWCETSEGSFAASASMFQGYMEARGLESINAQAAAEILETEFKVTDVRVAKLLVLWFEEVAGNDGLSPADFYELIIRGKFDKWVDRQLHPSQIQSHTKIDFVPADPHDTRGQGSWVVVCTVGSLLSVNLWIQDLLGYPTIASSVCDIRHWDTSASFGPWTNFNAFCPQPSPDHKWTTEPVPKDKEVDE